jgi:hypothetical protein
MREDLGTLCPGLITNNQIIIQSSDKLETVFHGI